MLYQRNHNSNPGPFGSLLSLLIFVGVLALLFFLVKGFFTLLYWVAPILLIATLIINYRVVGEYSLDLVRTLKRDVLMGILKILFTIFCYPAVIGWLFVKALFYRKMDNLRKDMEGQINQQYTSQYVDYEELSSEPNANDTNEKPTIELPKPKEQQRGNNPYDNLFDS